jgi:hypothetical protein
VKRRVAAQWALARTLRRRTFRGRPKQAIYRFRGADVNAYIAPGTPWVTRRASRSQRTSAR